MIQIKQVLTWREKSSNDKGLDHSLASELLWFIHKLWSITYVAMNITNEAYLNQSKLWFFQFTAESKKR